MKIVTVQRTLHFKRPVQALCAGIFTLLSAYAFAHGGEDHGDEAHAPVSAVVASGPQLEAASPDVELLGTLQGNKLTLYADHYASNEPISGASIELESDNNKVQAQPEKDGSYTATADWLAQPGRHEMVISIQAGQLEDLLTGTLTVPTSSHSTAGVPWAAYAKWAAIGAAALLVLALFTKILRQRKSTVASVALPLLAAALFSSQHHPAYAHGDEDHGEKPASATKPGVISGTVPAAAAPARLPDGSIYMPKAAQRVLGIRTVIARSGDIAQTFELNGRIIANPNFSGRVQSSQSGRIAAPAGGFPALGMKVSKDQILAYIEPAASSIDKGNQQAQLAELSSSLVLAENRAGRLAQLQGSVPQKEIDAARAEAVSLKARKAAVAGSFQREALRAPVAGVISMAGVVAGQVVEAREILFEIVDPSRLWVEALAYDQSLAGQVAGANGITADRQPLSLTFIGQSHQLREQALPMQFAITSPAPALNVGQPVKVVLQTRSTLHGTAVPADSIIKNSNGENIAWTHSSAERFIPKKVKLQALDAATTAITDGLHDGDRVVTQGAALLSQIR